MTLDEFRPTSIPWFNVLSSELVFRNAIIYDHFGVIEWFFAPAQGAYVGATLALLLPVICREILMCERDDYLEALLAIAEPMLSPERGQSLLNGLLSLMDTRSFRRTTSSRRAQLLLAHGAKVSVNANWDVAQPHTIRTLVTEGACFVVATCLPKALQHAPRRVVKYLLKFGVDVEGVASEGETPSLLKAAARCQATKRPPCTAN